MLKPAPTKDSFKKVDQYTDIELMSAFWKFFGAQRGVEIMGWSAVAALTSGGQTASDLRRSLEARGLTRSSLYRVLADLKRFAEEIEESPLPNQDTAYAMGILRRLSNVTVL